MKSVASLKTAQQRAAQKFRQKTAANGLIRLEVLVSTDDKPLIKQLAEALSSKAGAAQKIRCEIDQILNQARDETAFDMFGSTLSDATFEGLFDRMSQNEWRAVDL